jgi:transcription antitermination factor NusG
VGNSDASPAFTGARYPWFALQVRMRHEAGVVDHLEGKGYEWFLPLYKTQRRWSDRVKEVHSPLFPGYLFCRFNPPYLEVGSKVRIEAGALRGLEGILMELKGKRRLILSITLLQRSVAVEIDSDAVSVVQALQSARA